MARIYEAASLTLVLDSVLKMVNVSTSSAAKVVVRLLTCPWNHRLWTLEEAYLAKNLVFVFQDGLFQAWDLWRRTFTIENPIDLQCRYRLSQLLVHKNSIINVAHLICRRSTSDPNDEFLAVAPLLHLPVKTLTSKEGLERCCQFWILVKHVPRSIVFQIQEKIPTDGFRWAPRTLIGSKATTILHDNGNALVTATNGLRGTYDLLILPKGPHHLDFYQHRLYYLIEVSRRQIYRLTGLSWALHTIWCDAVLIENLEPKNSLGFGVTGAVCLLSRGNQSPGLDLPQYEYKLRLGINHGLRQGSEPFDWENVHDPAYLDSYMMGCSILCEVNENKAIYIV